MAAPATKCHIFHQNMMVFGGRSSKRNEAFKTKMHQICGGFGADRVIVAGFTEIVNDQKAVEAIKGIAANLDPGLTGHQAFACGITACNQKQVPEYVIISTFNKPSVGTFEERISGRVLLVQNWVGKQSWRCFSSSELDVDKMPQNFAPDSRGVAYVGGTYMGRDMIIGFMHNMYGVGNRYGGFQSLDAVATLIRAKHDGWGDKEVFIGGDFNVTPRPIRRNASLKHIAAISNPNDKKSWILTTLNHAYDFWLSTSNAVTSPNAKVWTETRDKEDNLSDHAGISLKLPWW